MQEEYKKGEVLKTRQGFVEWLASRKPYFYADGSLRFFGEAKYDHWVSVNIVDGHYLEAIKISGGE